MTPGHERSELENQHFQKREIMDRQVIAAYSYPMLNSGQNLPRSCVNHCAESAPVFLAVGRFEALVLSKLWKKTAASQ